MLPGGALLGRRAIGRRTTGAARCQGGTLPAQRTVPPNARILGQECSESGLDGFNFRLHHLNRRCVVYGGDVRRRALAKVPADAEARCPRLGEGGGEARRDGLRAAGGAVADAGVGSRRRDGVLEGLRRHDRLRGLLLRPAPAVAARDQREHQRLVRQCFPKGTDFSAVSDAEVEAARGELNGRPRRTLGWMSSSEAMAGLLGSDMAGAIRVRSCFFADRYRRAICP